MFTINRLKQVQHPSAAVLEQIREYEQTYLDMQRFDRPAPLSIDTLGLTPLS